MLEVLSVPYVAMSKKLVARVVRISMIPLAASHKEYPSRH